MAQAGMELVIVSDLFPRIIAAIPEVCSQVVRKTAEDVESDTKANIVTNGQVKTGNMLNSVEAVATGDFEAEVRVGAGYAGYQELGTRYLPPRPFLAPAVQKNQQPFEDAFRALEEAVR